MIGQYNKHDVFATFSLPEDGTRQRGYLMYDVLEMNDGCIIDSWLQYYGNQQRTDHTFHIPAMPTSTCTPYEAK